jgi:hypothetical protein
MILSKELNQEIRNQYLPLPYLANHNASRYSLNLHVLIRNSMKSAKLI